MHENVEQRTRMLPITEQEIDKFLASFEEGTLPKERWTHGAHLLTGVCYVHGLGESVAIDKMRLCVRRYNEAQADITRRLPLRGSSCWQGYGARRERWSVLSLAHWLWSALKETETFFAGTTTSI